MYLTRAKYEFLTPGSQVLDQKIICQFLEGIGRVCYKSEDHITEGTSVPFVSNILKMGHESVIEHYSFTVKFTTDRGVSHELVRHRLAAYSQESTRYCNYGKKGITYIIPGDIDLPEGQCSVYTLSPTIVYHDNRAIKEAVRLPEDVWDWALALTHCEFSYNKLLSHGWKPQKARGVLPNALKTEIVATYNLRQWRHVLKLRTMEKAHPMMRELTIPLLAELKQLLPIFFSDINNE